MITRSFLILPGIGEKRERQLWRAGCHDWESYLAKHQVPGVARAAKKRHESLVKRALEAHLGRDWARLAALFPNREHWRFYDEAAPRAGYLDIETTGTDPRSTITVVGVHDPYGGRTHQLVAGDDLDHERLKALLSRFDMLVTFNGNGFDLPVLRHHYPGAVPDVPHLDLRGPLQRLGYRGGLKRIEVDLGVARDDGVRGIDGYEAVLLWRRHTTRGDTAALDTLLAYNKEDVVNLEPLACCASDLLFNRISQYWGDAPRPVRWPTGSQPAHVPPEAMETPQHA